MSERSFEDLRVVVRLYRIGVVFGPNTFGFLRVVLMRKNAVRIGLISVFRQKVPTRVWLVEKKRFDENLVYYLQRKIGEVDWPRLRCFQMMIHI